MSGNKQPDRSGPFYARVPFGAVRDHFCILASENLRYEEAEGESHPALGGLGRFALPPGANGIQTSIVFDERAAPWFFVKLSSPGAPPLEPAISAEHVQWVFDARNGFFVEGENDLFLPGDRWAPAAVTFAAEAGERKRRQPGCLGVGRLHRPGSGPRDAEARRAAVAVP
jgi:hypothetical protein